ncbi:predicted protein [Postia placenta Mad-698-R]|nr:predicted protein [Postia placenta Mad-698-R]
MLTRPRGPITTRPYRGPPAPGYLRARACELVPDRAGQHVSTHSLEQSKQGLARTSCFSALSTPSISASILAPSRQVHSPSQYSGMMIFINFSALTSRLQLLGSRFDWCSRRAVLRFGGALGERFGYGGSMVLSASNSAVRWFGGLTFDGGVQSGPRQGSVIVWGRLRWLWPHPGGWFSSDGGGNCLRCKSNQQSVNSDGMRYAHLPFLPPSIVAEEAFTYVGLEHAFDAEDHVDVTRLDDPGALFFNCQARGDPDLPRRTEAVTQPPATPQAIPQLSLGPQLEGPLKTEPRDTPPHSWAGSSSAVTALTSVPVLRHPTSGLPPAPSPPFLLRGRPSTRSSRNLPGGQSQQLPSSADSPSSPSSPIMSSPAAAPDKETLKLLPLRYDGKSVVECNRFISQLIIYWTVNTALPSLKLKIQVALSLLDGDARAWATPIFSQLASVQIGIQGVTTPFANEAAFLKAFKARFGNLDDAAAAQVELAKLCADKTMRKKRTAAEFSALFKGPADRSGYGNLELRDKYLSGIPSRIYCKIELETFATWQAADKRAMEVEQILDVSWAHRPELNNFFSA